MTITKRDYSQIHASVFFFFFKKGILKFRVRDW
jgi:hypothetical protein